MALNQGLEPDTEQRFKPQLRGARDALLPPDACAGSQGLCYCDCSTQSILHTLPNAPTPGDPFINLHPSHFQPQPRRIHPNRGIINPRNATPTAGADTGVITVCVEFCLFGSRFTYTLVSS